MSTHSENKNEIFFSFILLFFSFWCLWHSYEISGFSSLSSAGALPMVASTVMVICAGSNIIRLLISLGTNDFAENVADPGKKLVPISILIMMVLLVIYGAALQSLGFLLSTFVFLVASFMYLYKSGWIRSLLLAIVALLLVYIIFRLIFSVLLPEGTLLDHYWHSNLGMRYIEVGASHV